MRFTHRLNYFIKIAQNSESDLFTQEFGADINAHGTNFK